MDLQYSSTNSPGSSGPRSARPFLSVILNFYDPRGHADHIKSWTQRQTLADDRFEVIAITTRARSSLADEIRSYLRPQDRLICQDTDQPFELYNPAVEVIQIFR